MCYIARATVGGDVKVVVASNPVDGPWHEAAALVAGVSTTRDAIRRMDELCAALASAAAATAIAVGPDNLQCPLDVAGKIFGVGLNYEGHIREVDLPVPDEPFVFVKSSNSLCGPFDDAIVDPQLTTQFDYENEVAIVIGKAGRNVAVEDALELVAAYAIGNDMTDRAWQVGLTHVQWLRAKGLDRFCPLGPWLTPRDAVDPDGGLAVQTLVNGDLRQDANTSDWVFGVAEMVSYLSQGVALEVGDLILTGSPAGVALGMEGQPWLKEGDVVRCVIEGLGEIANTVREVAVPAAAGRGD